MSHQDFKQAITRYIQKYYKQNKEAPSVRKILEHSTKERLSFSLFYKLFPGGLAEACRLAGVQIPKKRIKRMEKAISASKNDDKLDDTLATGPFRLHLTENQTKRILGISHLERGKDPSIIIDEILDRDALLRKHISEGELTVRFDQVYDIDKNGRKITLQTLASQIQGSLTAIFETFTTMEKILHPLDEVFKLINFKCSECNTQLDFMMFCKRCKKEKAIFFKASHEL